MQKSISIKSSNTFSSVATLSGLIWDFQEHLKSYKLNQKWYFKHLTNTQPNSTHPTTHLEDNPTGVWTLGGRCVEGFWWGFGGCLDGVAKVSEGLCIPNSIQNKHFQTQHIFIFHFYLD